MRPLLVHLSLLAVSLASAARADSRAPSDPEPTQAPAAQPAPAPASSVPSAAPAPEDDEALKRELEKSLQQDAKQRPGQPASAPASATSAPEAGPSAPASAPLLRGSQSLNPDISAILDGNFGFERRGVAYRNGDDPDLGAGPSSKAVGFTAQEVELALSAIVDPYFKGEFYLTIPNLNGLEVEEAFATTTSLPGNLQVKAGSFRSAFGRQNGQHLHIQDFTRRPLINAAFLGSDGLRGPGAQVSWLSPLPFYLLLSLEAFSLPAPATATDTVAPVSSFGGGTTTDLTYVGEAKAFFPAGEEWSIYLGASGATGVSAGYLRALGDGSIAGAGRRSELVGGDLYVKWKPANVSGGYTSVAWQTEAIFRHLEPGAQLGGEWDGGLYSQVVVQLARRWLLGLRGDVLGLPTSSVLGSALRGAASLTFQASEFARLRGYVEAEKLGTPGTGQIYLPSAVASAAPLGSFAAYLQLEISVGAHGAHPF